MQLLSKDIMNVPTFALLAGMATAFAFRPAPPLAHFYGVDIENAAGYVVAEEIDGEYENIDYFCAVTRAAHCTVSSNNTYTAGQTIPFSAAQPELIFKTFYDLNPYR